MRRLPLGTLLVLAVNALLLAAVAAVAFAATRHLQRLSDEQALDRIRHAGRSAAHHVERSVEEVAIATRLLAERPGLARLVETPRSSEDRELREDLDRFRETSQLSGIALLHDGRSVAVSGVPPPPKAPRPGGSGAPANGASLAPAPTGGLLAVSAAEVPGRAGWSVAVSRSLDPAFVEAIGKSSGVSVALLDGPRALAEGDDPRAYLRALALLGETDSVERVDDSAEYVAAMPLRAADGAVVGLLEARMPTASVDAALKTLRLRIFGLAGAVAGAATLCGVLLGRRLARPLRDLTEASARIGRGDLATPIPRAPGAETGRLAATMDEMRARLLHLTAELQRRRGDAESILSGIVEGVFSVDRERRVRYMNRQAEAMLGVAPGAALGRFCGDVLYPRGGTERPCETACPILHARFSGSARAAESVRVGETVKTVVVTSSAPAVESDGNRSPTLAETQFQVIRDETELEAARRARDAVLANISHEFRTPLAAQLASIELLRDRLPELSPDEGRELVLSLERGTIRLTRLIDNLLESVRIESGRTSIRRQPVALDEIVEEAAQMCRPLFDQRRQQLAIELPWPLPLLTGDAPRLAQVLVNLLANAQKFAPAGSTIRIGAAVAGGAAGTVAASAAPAAPSPARAEATPELRVWVEDEGPGLPAGGADLFAPFSRSEGEEPEAGGLGLGLFIARSIVERHGGRIEIAGADAGHGARVTIALPLSGEGGGPDVETSGGAAPQVGTGRPRPGETAS